MRPVLVFVMLTFAVTAHAATIWDESVDGDLSNDQTAPTDITLVSASDDVMGTVGGANPGEFFDCMRFDVPSGDSVNSIFLTSYVAAGGNTTSGFNLYTGTPADTASFGDLCSIAVGPANVGEDLLTVSCAGSPLATGTYTVCWREGTAGQAYTVTYVSTVPVELQSFAIE
ncbi:MAG: hypothetical protein V2I67_15285 [Thermoanaerobaculales bacterium]|nr:hypothetical protein [Thermoanaerobaculales bacterium]